MIHIWKKKKPSGTRYLRHAVTETTASICISWQLLYAAEEQAQFLLRILKMCWLWMPMAISLLSAFYFCCLLGTAVAFGSSWATKWELRSVRRTAESIAKPWALQDGRTSPGMFVPGWLACWLCAEQTLMCLLPQGCPPLFVICLVIKARHFDGASSGRNLSYGIACPFLAPGQKCTLGASKSLKNSYGSKSVGVVPTCR